ncbi:MAG TPA: hypothetical protein VHP99_04835 [Pyrinomonadaceae bacterium]|nr:hypothetical protein [Pyrinomonadaceae bacterium]
MKSLNETAIPQEFARCIAELTAQVAELSRRLQSIEEHQGKVTPAQENNLTIICGDDDQNSIEFHTENGFVIVRPWEAKDARPASDGVFRFRVQNPDGIEREISVEISNQLMTATALRARGRIEISSQFWICCAERRLANYLMEHGEFPPANEMKIETRDREDVLLAIRWGKSD